MVSEIEQFDRYSKLLGSIPGIKVADHSEGDLLLREFVPSSVDSRRVTLVLHRNEPAQLRLGIAGVDTDYWHTGEEETLDYYVRLAVAALSGDVRQRKTILGHKEVCFKLDEEWHCTNTDSTWWLPNYHYIKVRKTI